MPIIPTDLYSYESDSGFLSIPYSTILKVNLWTA